MPKHRTTDPAIRANHVANNLERHHECELAANGGYPYEDWPRFWLDTQKKVLAELVSEGTARGCELQL